ncbi:MAG: YggS family pyridoxal phosphate-dependent enzyme [Candidatus Thiodiazotropha sp. (ex Lucinoma aequizonata)]|nr:YggS family pyridoxal phosphate-dependent enzyme [Candidatus Thiodiazotropha sp. (ex Lucinoma aequizonata)]MCU7889167.1 YggS family pyridoxal phosphate-dependent enzyme [Candidatus Thiodiazotropha sp. (ex Lucinoma aequizonata)]MCU7894828.1 YggS family pyridoxal phosphate-dependent enzyme [Candidatus Thiodiazotropha sp. (ex Lucinoma aequizonata)]MCU7898360.1 YggS family pyridoxal phosphate-dependent enzyme [Candidatus Thiodiazotropha sp. (ex Lucinoma aequizonata)]MCU7901213.1 YggS family pyri
MTKQTKNSLQQPYHQVLDRIRRAEANCNRAPGSTQLLAVSKTRSADEIGLLADLGQCLFGENYLQEALTKITLLQDRSLEWHFIGRIQSNKTRQIAENFHWVHSVANLKHAIRLSDQRPQHLSPLNICLQVNINGKKSKDGHSEHELTELLGTYTALPNIRVGGLMTIPAPAEDKLTQHYPFQQLRRLRNRLRNKGLPLNTLSMGMSDDLESAIEEDATLVRIGTAIFGPRQYNQ